LAQSQQSSLGAKLSRIMVERRSSDRSKQNRPGRAAGIEGVGWQRVVAGDQGSPANVFLRDLELVTECRDGGIQNANRFGNYLRAYAVPRNRSDVQKHSRNTVAQPFGSRLHTPEIVFLVMVFDNRMQRDFTALPLARVRKRKCSGASLELSRCVAWYGRSGNREGCVLNMRGRYPLALRFANQLQYVMIIDIFDFVGKDDKSPINLVECSTIEFVPQLCALYAKSMTTRVLS